MIEMTRREFEELVSDALDELPAALTDLMDNVALFVEDAHPSEPGLLGLYEGVALTERDHTYSGWLPDRITIYRRPTLAICTSAEDVKREVTTTVVHEIAHHFGIDDTRLHQLGWA
jgi:predicted Zn-dependent protease with MMP-like domain